MIKINNLNFYYEKTKVLDNINLNINTGESLSILGSNGVGKTTLLSIIAKIRTFKNGDIVYDNVEYKDLVGKKLASLIGYVPQILSPVFDYNILEYVVTGCASEINFFSKPKSIHYEKAFNSLKKLSIEHLAKKSYREISGGERQQVSIARVLTQNPKYILMDEPTAHLDYGNQILVLKTIKDLSSSGYGIVLTTHNPDHALLLNEKVAILEKGGNLSYGKASEFVNSNFLEKLYNTNISLERFRDSRYVCFVPSL